MIIKLPICQDNKIIFSNFFVEKVNNPDKYIISLFNRNYEKKIIKIKVPCCNNFEGISYLDLFFPNDSITIKLLTFKETKKNCKPQINVEVNYKEMEADLNMLSGGELSRVSLSFILGLTEIFNSKILLLDECTSSLDQELTNTVIDGIRKNFADKLVIIIAHQVVSGVFDREIKL